MKIVPYKIAKLLWNKEYRDISKIGDVSSLYKTKTKEYSPYTNFGIYTHFSDGYISAPIYQDIIDWFLKTHNIIIYVAREWNGDEVVGFFGMVDHFDGNTETQDCTDYYEALDKAIKEALKLI